MGVGDMSVSLSNRVRIGPSQNKFGNLPTVGEIPCKQPERPGPTLNAPHTRHPDDKISDMERLYAGTEQILLVKDRIRTIDALHGWLVIKIVRYGCW